MKISGHVHRVKDGYMNEPRPHPNANYLVYKMIKKDLNINIKKQGEGNITIS